MTIIESNTRGHLLSASWPDTSAYGPISEFLADDDLDVAHGPTIFRAVAAGRRPQPHGLSDSWADRKLRRLRTLGDDWDGHGAAAPASEALARSHQFLVTLETWPRHVPRPDVMASTEGGVLVEWDADGVEVIIEFPVRGCVSVYLKTPRAEVEGPVEDHLHDLSEALSYFVRLT